MLLFAAGPRPAGAAGLPALPAAAAEFDAGSLHVTRFGSGDPVVLLPGLATGPWEWGEIVRRLAAAHTVYAVSLPGFDGRPTAPPPLFDRVIGDVWTMLDRQRIARPVVIGHSLGGILAIALAEQHPERLRSVVAVDGLPIIPTLEQLSPEQRAASAQQAAAQIAGATREAFLAYEKNFMRSPLGTIDTGVADAAAEREAASDPPAVAQWFREILTTDLRGGLSKATVPILEIAPYYAPDLTSSPMQYTEAQKGDYYRGLLAGAPNARVVTIAPARHFVQLDQPEKVMSAIDAFLAANH